MTTVEAAAFAAAKRPAGPGIFISSPGFDGFFFFASTLAVLAVWLAASRFNVAPFVIIAAVGIASNGPHLASTWSRVYFDRREWRTRPLHVFLVPALITAGVFTLIAGGPQLSRVPHTILLYWATWHFVAQCWGILRIYQRRSGEPDSRLALRLEKPLLMLIPLYCLAHRVMTGPHRLFGTRVYVPDVPPEAVSALGSLLLVIAVALVALRLADLRTPWAGSAWLRLAFIGCAFVGFYAPFVLMRSLDGTASFAAAAAWHGLQYIGIVRYYHRNAWRQGVHPSARIVSWLSQPGTGRTVLYGVFLLALAGVAYGVIQVCAYFTRGTMWTATLWATTVWQSLTFSHYYLDGVIWKLRRDKVVAQRLGLAPS